MKYLLSSILGASVALTGCGGSGGSDGNGLNKNVVEFTGIDAADANEAAFGVSVAQLAADSKQRQVVSTPSMNVYGTKVDLQFRPIIKSGDQPVAGGATWGEPIKRDGTTFGSTNLAQATSSAYLNINSKRASYSPDHSTLLQKAGKLFSITQFENYNGSMYITELSQAANGVLTAIATKPIDLSSVFGGWDFCAGIPTPWSSHLAGEEYPEDARSFEANTTSTNTLDAPSASYSTGIDEYFEYFGLDQSLTNSSTKANSSRAAAAGQTSVYRVGFPVEVKLTSATLGTGNTAANTSVAKHYSMGRLAWELAYVMPDKKTVYGGDDGSFRGMFRYVATTAEDLTAGKLYAAKLTQVSADNGGTFNIDWKPLYTGSGTTAVAVTDTEISDLIAGGIKFSDMIDYQAPTSNSCASGYTPYVLSTSAKECIKLKGANGSYTADQIEKAASRLETLRYAVIKGATQEFEKYEGVTFDPSRNKMYIAISSIRRGMASSGYTETLVGAGNDINIAENLCGAVYQLDVTNEYVTYNMKTLIAGASKTYNNGVQCDLDKIGMPDNVAMGPTNDYLLIGEDSDWLASSKSGTTSSKVHRNDVLWAYDLKNSKLTRILSSPVGAEVTSPMYYRNINGWDYITAVIQHPYGESDTDQTTDVNDKRAIFGIIGPIPTFTPK